MNRKRWILVLMAGAAVLIPHSGAAVQQTITYAYDALGRLTAASYDGAVSVAYEYDASGNIVRIVTQTPQDVSEREGTADLPRVLVLRRSAPNPFRDATEVLLGLPAAAQVRLELFDATGRLVRVLVDGPIVAGYHAIRWDGRDDAGRPVPSGVFFYRLQAQGKERTQAVVALR